MKQDEVVMEATATFTDKDVELYERATTAGIPTVIVSMYKNALRKLIAESVERKAAAERESMTKDGWRRCAVGQRTTQFCGMLEDAVKAEREACAAVCDEVEKRKWLTVQNGGRLDGVGARDCAAGIRARGEK